ncbi:unnamed protein product [Caenorhabditis bovis]|uniref:dihydropyrimidinase n=1 Tax=Caenorhabditis bovis TaxID=2654633 RepID=A0A8S1F285_9PELO|nr:unnamed protein product [Caenorhabditis bovis]
MSILIKNGAIVNDDFMQNADVLVKDGKIIKIGENINVEGEVEIVDATDRYVIPGGIDPHTHMQLPFMGEIAKDDFHRGTEAAVAGGTTMIIDFVIPNKGESLLAAYDRWRKWADPKVVCDYGLSMAITTWNSEIAAEMRTVTAPEYGINSFKFFLAYAGMFMVRDEEFYQGMLQCAKLRALARVHAENGAVIKERSESLLAQGVTGPEGHTQSRPEELEAEATFRACTMAAQANCPLYIVHVMSKGAADAIAHHRKQGYVVFGEPIAAGLGTDGSHYYHEDWLHAARYVMSPPLSRDPTTPSTLMKLLAAGELHLTATDNCTFDCKQKALGKDDFTKIPNGVNGVEDRMSVVWEKGVHSGLIDPMKFVSVTSTMAAKIFNCYPRKGRIAVGSDADIVIWNANSTRVISKDTHHHAVDFNIFEGMKVHGVPEITIAGGRIVWRDGKLLTTPGAGKFIALKPDSQIVFASIDNKAKSSAPIKINRAPYNPEERAQTGRDAAHPAAAAASRNPPGGKSSIEF